MVKRRGFTLIELLVVMAIVATLLTLTLPRYFRSVENSRVTVLMENLCTTRDAIDKFYGDKGRYPDSLDELVSSQYLSALPIDPAADAPATWTIVAPPNDAPGKVYDIKSPAAGTTQDGRALNAL